MIRDEILLPKLLLPAGEPKAVDAAIDAGADEIYFGGEDFSARKNARNLTREEIREAIIKCHFFGVKTNAAVNTLILDKEYGELLSLVEFLYKNDCDSLIVADLGAAAEIRRRFPDLEMHASTQCAAHNADAAKILHAAGFSRTVLARELSFEDVKEIKDAFPDTEYEIFVHGAHCVCHSGLCEYSYYMGGRSGNRGECAQPCRLPDKRGDYPLSLKDMCLAGHMEKIIALGVSALKIEGRMKSPEYVYATGKIYRTLLDEGRNATPEEIEKLSRIFSRNGHTDGYFTGKVGASMLGVRSEADKENSKEAEAAAAYEMRNADKRLPVSMTAEFHLGSAARLYISTGSTACTVYGAMPEPAQNAPSTPEMIAKNLKKLGNTPFSVSEEDLHIIADPGIMVPVSALNSLRRTACEQLIRSIDTTYHKERKGYTPAEPASEPARPHAGVAASKNIAHFLSREGIPPRIYLGTFAHIFLPIDEYLAADEGTRSLVDGISVPPVCLQTEMDALEEKVIRAKLLGAVRLEANNLSTFMLAEKYDFIPCAGLGIGVYSGKTAAFLKLLEAESAILSPELNLAQIRDICLSSPLPVGVAVYGKLPMMVLEKCIIRDRVFGEKAPEQKDCRYCDSHPFWYFEDRRGARLPVRRLSDHRNLLLNSVPLYMADLPEKIGGGLVGNRHFFFTDESAADAAQVIEAYRTGAPSGMEVRRLH